MNETHGPLWSLLDEAEQMLSLIRHRYSRVPMPDDVSDDLDRLLRRLYTALRMPRAAAGEPQGGDVNAVAPNRDEENET